MQDMYGALIGGMISGGEAWHSAKESRLASKRAYRYWERQLEQGPTARVRGLRKAGLNPILAAGGLGGGGGGGGSIPTQPGITPDIAGNVGRMSRLSPEMKLLRQQTAKEESATHLNNNLAAVNAAKEITEQETQNLIRENTANARDTRALIREQAIGKKYENVTSQVLADFYSSAEGQTLLKFQQMMGSLNSAGGIAGTIGRGIGGLLGGKNADTWKYEESVSPEGKVTEKRTRAGKAKRKIRRRR